MGHDVGSTSGVHLDLFEYGMSVLVSGETASGKTTTLNAILPFIDHNVKIYSAEDTPEVKVRHKIWQRLVTRDAKNEDSRVEMFDLLKAALRSRPRYIIIGEIRGVEGATAFQAMQTGHPVIATFHASSIVKMIQRFTGDPINVPIRFFDNLNFAIFQEVVEAPGGGIARRITGIDEVIGYNKHSDGVLTRGMFEWDPVKDKHYFRGMFQSHLLENKIAAMAGFANKRDIYDEMLRRADAIQRMADRDLTHYDDVFDLLGLYYTNGWDHFSRAIDTWSGSTTTEDDETWSACQSGKLPSVALEMPVPRFLFLRRSHRRSDLLPRHLHRVSDRWFGRGSAVCWVHRFPVRSSPDLDVCPRCRRLSYLGCATFRQPHRRRDAHVHHAMGILSIGEVGAQSIFDILKQMRDYGELASEVKRIETLVDKWHTSLPEAARIVAHQSPSSVVVGFPDRMAFSIEAGQPIDEFMRSEQETIAEQYNTLYDTPRIGGHPQGNLRLAQHRWPVWSGHRRHSPRAVRRARTTPH